MDEKSVVDRDEVMYSSESEDEEIKNARGCASSYLVEERENSNKILPQKFRERWFRAATLVALVSFISAVAFSLASFITSQATESSSVFATGFDSFLAAINVVAVCWRFRDELNGDIGPMRETKATAVIAITFVLGGIATVVFALHNLITKDHPTKTYEMMVVLGAGAVMYPILAFFQGYVSEILQSPSMRALAVDTTLGAIMSVGVLGSTYVYYELHQFWYLDHAVAILLGGVSLIYGITLIVELLGLNLKEKLVLAFQREL